MESNNSNVTSHNNSTDITFDNEPYILYVLTCIIISIGLPLTLLAIYSLSSQIKNDHVAPIFIINLLISDLIQFCYMIVLVSKHGDERIFLISYYIYNFGLMASVCFMVCIALERYLVIAWPLWYRFRRTIKMSLVVCVMVWTFPLVYVLPLIFNVKSVVLDTISIVLILVPFPLLIFFLGGSLKALSAAISVPSDEKRRIVGMLVLVLLIYTLLFLPYFISLLSGHNYTLFIAMAVLVRCGPLADLILYVFMRKGAIDQLLASLCCCRMDSDDNIRSDNNMYIVSSMQAEK